MRYYGDTTYYWDDPPPGRHDTLPRARPGGGGGCEDGTVWVTRIGRGWLAVTPGVWAAFTAAVKRGDYDDPPRRHP